MGLSEVIERLEENFILVFDNRENRFKYFIALFVGVLLIDSSFKLSIFTGVCFVITILWLFLFKGILFIDNPYYIIVVFGILAIRWAIGDVAGNGLLFIKSGDIISGIIYLVTWLVIYFKTREIQRH